MPAEQAPQTIEFKPRGRAVQVAESDSSQIDAGRDSVDNVLDATKISARGNGDLPEKVTVRIEYHPGGAESESEERIIIKDNGAQGVPPDELGKVLALGASSKGQDLIGEFGIGGLRYFALGDTVHVGSNHPDYEPSEFTARAPELRADNTGDIEVFEAKRRDIDDLEEGWFRVTIEDLKSGIDGLIQSAIDDIGIDVGNENDQVNTGKRLVDQEALSPVEEAFGRTYHQYLENGIPVTEANEDRTIPFEIVLFHGRAGDEGQEYETTVDPVPPPNLVRLPTDGLGPRKYQDVPLSTSGAEDPTPEIYADVEVGLQKQSDEKMAGLYLSFQDRMILYADLQSRLFDSSYLGSLNDASGQTRLIIKVDIREAETEEDNRSYLPINSAKTGFDYNNYATDRLLNFVSNAADPYKNQVYQRLRPWFLSSFVPQENPNLDSSELPEPITKAKNNSKTNKAAANPKPGFYASGKRLRDYPERDILQTIIIGHDLLEVRVSQPEKYFRSEFSDLASEETQLNISPISKRKAQQFAIVYDHYFEHHYPRTGERDDIVTVPKPPVEVEWQEGPNTTEWTWIQEGKRAYELEKGKEVPDFLHQIKEIAQDHVDKGGRGDRTTAVAEWQKPRYLKQLRRDTCNKTTTDGETIKMEIGKYRDLELWDVVEDIPDDESAPGGIENEGMPSAERETRSTDDGPASRSIEDEGTSSVKRKTRSTDDRPKLEKSGTVRQTQQREQVSLDHGTQQIDEIADSSSSTEPHSQPRRSMSEMKEGIVFVSDGEQTTLEQAPPDRGIIIIDDNPLVVGKERYEAVQEKLAEMGYDESDMIHNIDAALERLEELEAAAAVFQNPD